jgi:hypothetical protein
MNGGLKPLLEADVAGTPDVAGVAGSNVRPSIYPLPNIIVALMTKITTIAKQHIGMHFFIIEFFAMVIQGVYIIRTKKEYFVLYDLPRTWCF